MATAPSSAERKKAVTTGGEDEELPSTSALTLVSTSTATGDAIVSDQSVHTELLVLIERYLRSSTCNAAATALRNEIVAKKLLPKRVDWLGKTHPMSYQEYSNQIPPTQASLPQMLDRLASLVDTAVPPAVKGLRLRLVASKRHSLARTTSSIIDGQPCFNGILGRDSTVAKAVNSPIRMLTARELGTRVNGEQLVGPQMSVQSMEEHFKVLAHLSSVFCVAFDKTGEYVITGADDNLVKVWSVRRAVLRFTYRGHSAEIADLSVSHCNNVCASGSIDKTVRVWSLKNGETFHVFRVHTATVSVVSFLPYVSGTDRYLISTAYDCTVNFYKWTVGTNVFEPNPTRFFERTGGGAPRIVSACHSPGGNIVAVGDTHRDIRIYRITSDMGVVRLFEYSEHTDRVDSLVWSNSGLRFASGSRDGLAKIWTFAYGKWKTITLNALTEEHPPEKAVSATTNTTARSSKNTYKVTMLCWTSDDELVVTSGTDHILRVWDPIKGRQLRYLTGHKDDAFVLSAHPRHPSLIFSGSHDGSLIVWDVKQGAQVKTFKNMGTIEGLVYMPIFDLTVSEDGSRVAVVDSYGHLTLFGLGPNYDVMQRPKAQFFHTDYRPLFCDDEGNVIDEEMGIAPELMPPPRLVDQDGVPLPNEIQRLVPGRETWNGVDEDLECPWLTRQIVHGLQPGVYDKELERITELGDRERDTFIEEFNKKEPEPVVAAPIVAADGISTRRRSRPAAAPPQNRRSRRGEHIQPVRYIEAVQELPESPEGSAYSSSEEERSDAETSETDSSDSDFSIGARRNSQERERSQPSELLPTSSGRRRRAPDAQRTAEQREQRKVQRKTRRTVVVEDDEDMDELIEETMEDQPGPSNAEATTKKKAPKKKRIPEFPAWMRATTPRRFPYIAQLGDKVVYMKQGHEDYVNAVERAGLYPLKGKMRPLSELDAEEFAVVDEVRYVRRPYRLTALKLTRLDENGERTNFTWSVKFHDFENVLDFIILKAHYEASVERPFGVGDRIEAIVDDCWYLGTVKKIEPLDEEYPRSHWLSLMVCWDTGDEERMSPWDCQLLSPGRNTGPAEESDHLTLAECPEEEGDWPEVEGLEPSELRETCEQRMISILETMVDLETVAPFAKAVDLEEYPNYPDSVDYPIDLGTIKIRLENHFYRRVRALQQDIRYVAMTAEQFNEPNSVIVRNARVVVEALIRLTTDTSITDVVEFYDRMHDLPDHELVEHKRKQRTKSSMNLEEAVEPRTAGWVSECKAILEQIFAEPCAQHFLRARENPELDLVFEDYLDLMSISEKLIAGGYPTPKDLKADVDSLMQGVRQMAENKRSQIYRDSLRLSSRFEEAMQSIVARFERCVQNVQRQLEEVQLSRLRKRPPRLQMQYNTRSRDNRASEEPGPSHSQSGRSLRYPLNGGYYRSLHNGDGRASPEEPVSRLRRRNDRQMSDDGDTRDSVTSQRSLRNGDRRGARRETTEESDVVAAPSSTLPSRTRRGTPRVPTPPPAPETRRMTRSRREEVPTGMDAARSSRSLRARRGGGRVTLEDRECQQEIQELLDDREDNLPEEEHVEDDEEEEEEEEEEDFDEALLSDGEEERKGRKRKHESSEEEQDEFVPDEHLETEEHSEEEEEEVDEDETSDEEERRPRRNRDRRAARSSRASKKRRTTPDDDEYGASTARGSRRRSPRIPAPRAAPPASSSSRSRPTRAAAAARRDYAESDDDEEEETVGRLRSRRARGVAT